MQDKTDFRLNKLENNVEKIDERLDDMDKMQVEMKERLKSNEKLTDKLNEVVEEIRISNINMSHVVTELKEDRTQQIKSNLELKKMFYGAIITAVIGGLVSLIVAMI